MILYVRMLDVWSMRAYSRFTRADNNQPPGKERQCTHLNPLPLPT